ncbi:ATP-binding protein [Bacillus sp. 1P06AnD]|uniref:ATP-binding protein n=1 Tax=Bacillus sp. 1P06AnD TaxID=3132208 RepID=UPI00399F8417
MKLSAFLREKSGFLFINILILLFIELFLYFIHVQGIVMWIVLLGWLCPLLISYLLDWFKHYRYFKEVMDQFETLDKKYLLSEVIEEPDFIEGQIFYGILSQTDKEMHEHVNEYKNMQLEYRDYIEAWVHEIKTPIASSKLMLENQKNSSSRAVLDELESVERYIEQALYYARSSSASKDYLVKEFALGRCIANVVKKNARGFIQNKIRLDMDEIHEIVFSDEKWVDFILTQIIVNAINYCKGEENTISIKASKHENNVILHISDNGVGINEKDIKRVFDKGFTGENGRAYRKSTGMGLYLCKKLADKLHLGISIKSQKGVGTEVSVIFPKSKVVLLES